MRKTLGEAVVSLICDIESRLTLNQRSPEHNEYRRGYQEALTGLKSGVPMIDVMDALQEQGWRPPQRSWMQPDPAPHTDQEGGSDDT